MAPLAFLVPGDLDLPTGGYIYDRRVLALLGQHGIKARHVALPGSFPEPTAADLAETARIVAALPANAVLLIDGLALGAMPARLIRGFGRRLIALCHHPLCLEAGLDADRQSELRASETAALAHADAVIATSPATRSLLVREFFVPADRISVAVPGTDPAQRARGSDDAPLQLLAVGSIVPRKGYDVLIRALGTLQDLDWRLTIAGAEDRSPATAESLRRQVPSQGLAARVTLKGTLDSGQLAQLYDRTDLFVMPSLFEGYGMVLAEAMARGLPIVCTTGGAAAETAPDAAAIKVPPGDAPALASALRHVIENESLRRSLADASWDAGRRLPRWVDTAGIVAGVVRRIAK